MASWHSCSDIADLIEKFSALGNFLDIMYSGVGGAFH